MSAPAETSLLTIGGVALPRESHLDLSIEHARSASGRRRLSLRAAGWWPPELDALSWSAPVTVTYADLALDGGTATLTILTAGPTRTDDLGSVNCQWTLAGVEAAATGSAVSVGGVPYWAEVSVSAPRALARRQIKISGESATAPTMSGSVVALVSTLYSGNLIALGVASQTDSETGLVAWSIDGWEAPTGSTLVKVAGTDYWGAVSVSAPRALARRQIKISGESATAPTMSGSVVALVSTLYSGNLIALGVASQTDSETGLVAWSIDGWEAPTGSTLVKVAGTDYWGAVSVSAPRALARRQIKISGESATAPTMSGSVVALVSTLYSGNLIALGVASQTDSETGLVSWSIDGWEAPTGSTLVKVAGTDYWATIGVTTTRSGTRRALRISGESAAVPAAVGAVVAVSSLAYTGSLVVQGVSATALPETGLIAWDLSGWDGDTAAGSVTIGGTAYWGTVAREPIGGTIQRKTNGAGTLLHAWGKSRVTLSGEGASAPAVSGVVAVISTLYTGNLLVSGVGARVDAETGLVSWTITGEQP